MRFFFRVPLFVARTQVSLAFTWRRLVRTVLLAPVLLVLLPCRATLALLKGGRCGKPSLPVLHAVMGCCAALA